MGEGSWLEPSPALIWRQLTPTVQISDSAANLISDSTLPYSSKHNKCVVLLLQPKNVCIQNTLLQLGV